MKDLHDLPDKTILTDIVTMPMPFGKYKGTIIGNLPVYYLEWLASQGFRDNRLGQILSTAFIIRTHGLDDLLNNIK